MNKRTLKKLDRLVGELEHLQEQITDDRVKDFISNAKSDLLSALRIGESLVESGK